jgi:hypothetical protein
MGARSTRRVAPAHARMEVRMNHAAAIDVALCATTTIYALTLDRLGPYLEPELAWAEVAVGTTICLTAAAVRARLTRPHCWRSYERCVWRSFAVGGAPIVAWQVLRTQRRYRQAIAYAARRLYEHRIPPRSTQTLAQSRGTGTPGERQRRCPRR